MRLGQRDALRGKKVPENPSFFSEQLGNAARVHRVGGETSGTKKREGVHRRRRDFRVRRIQEQI